LVVDGDLARGEVHAAAGGLRWPAARYATDAAGVDEAVPVTTKLERFYRLAVGL